MRRFAAVFAIVLSLSIACSPKAGTVVAKTGLDVAKCAALHAGEPWEQIVAECAVDPADQADVADLVQLLEAKQAAARAAGAASAARVLSPPAASSTPCR